MRSLDPRVSHPVLPSYDRAALLTFRRARAIAAVELVDVARCLRTFEGGGAAGSVKVSRDPDTFPATARGSRRGLERRRGRAWTPEAIADHAERRRAYAAQHLRAADAARTLLAPGEPERKRLAGRARRQSRRGGD